MDQYSQGGFDSQHTGTQQQQQQPEARKSNVRPVTIRQLLSSEPASDDVVLLDHKPLRHVRFVGVVRNVIESETGSRFRIEDGTGMVDARLYSSGVGATAENVMTDGDDGEGNLNQMVDEKKKASDLFVDRYVSVFARVSISNDRHNIAINDIRLIEDPNEVAYHMLNAIHHHIASVGGFVGQQGGNSAATAHAGANTGGNANSLFVGGTGAIAANAGGAGNLGDRILDYLRRFESLDSGVHIQSLVQGLGTDYSTIKEALEVLNEEGFIYNPDDDHYAITPQN